MCRFDFDLCCIIYVHYIAAVKAKDIISLKCETIPGDCSECVVARYRQRRNKYGSEGHVYIVEEDDEHVEVH